MHNIIDRVSITVRLIRIVRLVELRSHWNRRSVVDMWWWVCCVVRRKVGTFHELRIINFVVKVVVVGWYVGHLSSEEAQYHLFRCISNWNVIQNGSIRSCDLCQ